MLIGFAAVLLLSERTISSLGWALAYLGVKCSSMGKRKGCFIGD